MSDPTPTSPLHPDEARVIARALCGEPISPVAALLYSAHLDALADNAAALIAAQPWPANTVDRDLLLTVILDETSWDWPDDDQAAPAVGCDTSIPTVADQAGRFADRIIDVLPRQAPPVQPVLTRKQAHDAIAPVLFNTSNYPRKAQPYLLGENYTPLLGRLLDAIDAVTPEAPLDSSELARINRNLLARIRELEQAHLDGVHLTPAECGISAAGLNWAAQHPTDGAPAGWGSTWTALAERLRAAQ